MAGNNLLAAKILRDSNTTKGGTNALAEQFPELYGAIKGLLGTAPDEVGGSVLDGSHQAQKAGAGYGFPIGLLAQMLPLAKVTKGMPVGMSIKAVDGQANGLLGVLGKKSYPVAPRGEWYGDANFEQTGGKMVSMSPDEYLKRVRPLEIDDVSRENIDLLKQHIKEGKTLDPLAIYKGGKEDGRHRAYAAKELGIDSVPVIDWNAPKFVYPQEKALLTAQRNAALPVEQGGLGLHPNNTPMERAQAMGGVDVYHGTNKDFPAFDVSKGGWKSSGAGSREGALGPFTSDNTDAANNFAQFADRNLGGGNVMPLVAFMDKPMEVKKYAEIKDLVDKHTQFARPDMGVRMMQDKINPQGAIDELTSQGYDSIALRNTMTDSPDGSTISQFVHLDPAKLRSRFAAFDPFRRNEPDLLAGALPFSALADEENRNQLRGLLGY